MKKKQVTLLGSTGSIGQNTLDVLSQHLEHFRVFALTAHTNAELLYRQCLKYKPHYAVLTHPSKIEIFKKLLKQHPLSTQLLTSHHDLLHVASHSQADIVVSAISGSAGLLPTFEAAKTGKTILLANKEALVMAGSLLMQTIQSTGATLLPVDSEHNAIFQCLPLGYRCGTTPVDVRKIILTASGGPFRTLPLEKFDTITVDQALEHPNWKMGKKISIDSATMMNKALEVIEAHYLFNLPSDQIEVIIHPESIIHSCVQYQDNSTLAQMGYSDMRIPITHALFYPDRTPSFQKDLNFQTLKTLRFESVDERRFPLLKLAYTAIEKGGSAPIILNAVNEIAVNAFLSKQLKFTDIALCVQKTFQHIRPTPIHTLEDVLRAHEKASHTAQEILTHFG
jgi:1-deoxy-D-xylulose-5-phosphate reductoisomerase